MQLREKIAHTKKLQRLFPLLLLKAKFFRLFLFSTEIFTNQKVLKSTMLFIGIKGDLYTFIKTIKFSFSFYCGSVYFCFSCRRRIEYLKHSNEVIDLKKKTKNRQNW